MIAFIVDATVASVIECGNICFWVHKVPYFYFTAKYAVTPGVRIAGSTVVSIVESVVSIVSS